MKTLVIGLGNPILGDDGVGWRVAEKIRQELDNPQSAICNLQSVEVDCVSLGGLSLMERLTGYERVILIDAISTGKKPLGSVTIFTLDSLPDLTAGHSASAHDTSLRTALKVGRSMNLPLPQDDQVLVVAIEAQSVYDFSQELSPAISAAVPLAVEATLELLRSNQEGE